MKTRIAANKSVATRSSDNNSPRVAKDVLSRKNADGSIAIMKLSNDDYFFTLDGIAAEIWLKFNGKTKLSKIKEQIIVRHSPPAARFEKDVKNLISTLKKENLIEL